MIATTHDHRYEPHRHESQFDESLDDDSQFERFTYRARGEFPVRSHAARSRAKMRDRGTSAARSKSRSYNGVNRRGRGKQWAAFR
jgi:hypothetical protein